MADYYVVTGEGLEPDCAGDYFYWKLDPEYPYEPLYLRTDGQYYIQYAGEENEHEYWYIKGITWPDPVSYWAHVFPIGTGILGEYIAEYPAEGTATVSLGVANSFVNYNGDWSW